MKKLRRILNLYRRKGLLRFYGPVEVIRTGEELSLIMIAPALRQMLSMLGIVIVG
jgi:hypothetical protein